jgi:dephospho-CoA kinase
MKIIAFTGMPFSGKSEAVEIAKSMNFPIIRMGDMVWEEVKRQKLELNDKNVGFIANNMRKIHGMDIWAKKTLEQIKKLKENKCLIIDGVRNIEEINTFKQELDKDFKLIAITVSDEIRFKRAMTRDRKDDSKDINLIKERDKRELSWGLEHVISSADIKIVNEGSITDFKNKIKMMLDEI